MVENTLLDDRTDTAHSRLFILTSHPFGAGAPTRMLVRTSHDARSLVPAVRTVLQTLTPAMPFVQVQTMEDLTAPQLRPWRLGTTMFLLFGSAAMLIASVGLYSTVAHAVSQRTHEIGVRTALGASRWRIVMLVSTHSAVTVAIGLAIGLVAASVAALRLAGLLYDTTPHAPVVFVTVTAVLFVSAVVAAVVPARRATRVNPLDALKME